MMLIGCFLIFTVFLMGMDQEVEETPLVSY